MPRSRSTGGGGPSSSFRFRRIARAEEPRADLVRTGGLEPPPPRGEQIFVPLRLSLPPQGRSWSGLSLRHGLPAAGAARLVSTPSPGGAWLGIGLGHPLSVHRI